jgi:hypothetical protein
MRATTHEELSEIVADFLDKCGIEPPFYLVSISTNGFVIVNHWPAVGEVDEEVCCMRALDEAVLPIVLTVISLDGRSVSARIVAGDHGARLLQ